MDATLIAALVGGGISLVTGGIGLWIAVAQHRQSDRLAAMQRDLAVASELHRGEMERELESLRALQSPKVSAATEFWSAFCGVERRLRDMIGAYPAERVEGDVNGEKVELMAALRKRWEEADAGLDKAMERFEECRDRAECLMPEEEFEALEKAYSIFTRARTMKITGIVDREHLAKHTKDAADLIEETKGLRKDLARVMRAMLVRLPERTNQVQSQLVRPAGAALAEVQVLAKRSVG